MKNFTSRQEDLIADFHDAMKRLVMDHCMPEQKEKAECLYDDPEFYGELCELVATFCADHGVDLLYPMHETVYRKDGECEEVVSDTTPPTCDNLRKTWDEKWEQTRKAMK